MNYILEFFSKFSFKYILLFAGIALLPTFFGDYYQAVIDLIRYIYASIVNWIFDYDTAIFVKDYVFIYLSILVYQKFTS
jgi:hypothetical protein